MLNYFIIGVVFALTRGLYNLRVAKAYGLCADMPVWLRIVNFAIGVVFWPIDLILEVVRTIACFKVY